MPTWKRREANGTSHFLHLCSACSQRRERSLEDAGWQQLRPGEPASCHDCALKCRLTADGMWGATDPERYAICDQCPEFPVCDLKGRYFC